MEHDGLVFILGGAAVALAALIVLLRSLSLPESFLERRREREALRRSLVKKEVIAPEAPRREGGGEAGK